MHGQAKDVVASMSYVGICCDGKLATNQTLQFSIKSGLIVDVRESTTTALADQSHSIVEAVDDAPHSGPVVELDPGDVVAPGLIELQTNGLIGVHFTTLTADNAGQKLDMVAREMAKNGVTGWYATVPSIDGPRWQEILPLLKPKNFDNVGGSPLLGAHVEGPYLHPAKKGAHDKSFFKTPSLHPYREVYGEDNLKSVIRYITIAPELDGAPDMIADLAHSYPHAIVSLGHSTASYDRGLEAVDAGARSLTHVFNAMNQLHHRDPGLAGLIAAPSSALWGDATQALDASLPYFTIIPDLVHLHPSILRLCYQSKPNRCILITDSIELAGLPNGVYPPNGQITYAQRKQGNRATNVADASKGEKETLIGSCITLPEAVRNMVNHAGILLAEAVRCASTNVAELMRDESRGRLVTGKRADFIVMSKDGYVKQTWIGGKLVWSLQDEQAT